MKMSLRLFILIAGCLTLACASVTVKQVQNSTGSTGLTLTSDSSGVRFYRPKPHVWITRAVPPDKVNVESKQTKTTEATPGSMTKTTEHPGPPKEVLKENSDGTIETTEGYVKSSMGTTYEAKIVFLPDYSQEFVVQWKSGLGSASPSFTLTDGWNLTAFDSTVDSKAAELVTSVGTVAAAGLLAGSTNFQGPGLYQLDEDASGKLELGELVLPLE